MKRKPDVTDLFGETKRPELTEEQRDILKAADVINILSHICIDLSYQERRDPQKRALLDSLTMPVHEHSYTRRHPIDAARDYRRTSQILIEVVRQNTALRALLEERLSDEDRKRLKALKVQWQLEQANPDAGEGPQPNNSIFL